MAKKSLRGAINAHCKSCIYDANAPGTWLAQVSLCSVVECALYQVRPTTESIPDSVYEYYGEQIPHKSIVRSKKAPEGRFSEESRSEEARRGNAA